MQRLRTNIALAFFMTLAGVVPLAGAEDMHSGHGDAGHADHAGHSGAKVRAQQTQVAFADVALVDQHGQALRLADTVGGHIVVMGFIYTSCTTVCPVISAIMQKVQAQLGERVGDEVLLLSVTVDPVRDTPSRLLEYSRAYQAGPGWRWVTGEPKAVNDTLKGLGVWSADYTSHPPTLLVGDGRSGEWTRYYGFTAPALLVERVDQLAEARAHEEADHLAHRPPNGEDRP